MVDHPSQAGYYGRTLSPRLAGALVAIGDAMIPAEPPLPAGGEISRRFIDEFGSPRQIDELEQLLPTLANASIPDAISTLERERPADFDLLRWVVYHAYYGSPIVIDILQQSDFDYHGAPQPNGYEMHGPASIPRHQRGSYIRTEEVSNARQG